MTIIYLDNSATTQVDKQVMKSMQPYFLKKFGNASTLYDLGKESRKAIDESRKKIADFLKVNENEIIFTSSGTESDNLAIKGLALHPDNKKKKHIITSEIEHPAILNTVKVMRKEGYEIDFIKVDKEGIININEIKQKIRENTLVVSIMHVNNEIGTIQPIEEIAKICNEKNVYFHTDAVQSFTKIPIDMKNIDLLSASAHKINGPKGIGLIYIKKGTKISPIIDGGGHEFGLRSSTENIPGIVGFAKAVEISKKTDKKKIEKMGNYIIEELLKIPDSKLNGSREKRVYNNVNISFRGIEGEGLLMILNREGICVSTGSACSSKSLSPSHVLASINDDILYSHGSLRITLGKETKENEIKKTIKIIKQAVKRLREISPDPNKLETEIDENWSIKEVVNFKPESEQIFLKHGIAVGECIMDMHQSLKECIKSKDVNVNELLNELRNLK